MLGFATAVLSLVSTPPCLGKVVEARAIHGFVYALPSSPDLHTVRRRGGRWIVRTLDKSGKVRSAFGYPDDYYWPVGVDLKGNLGFWNFSPFLSADQGKLRPTQYEANLPERLHGAFVFAPHKPTSYRIVGGPPKSLSHGSIVAPLGPTGPAFCLNGDRALVVDAESGAERVVPGIRAATVFGTNPGHCAAVNERWVVGYSKLEQWTKEERSSAPLIGKGTPDHGLAALDLDTGRTTLLARLGHEPPYPEEPLLNTQWAPLIAVFAERYVAFHSEDSAFIAELKLP